MVVVSFLENPRSCAKMTLSENVIPKNPVVDHQFFSYPAW